jgi:hypothetical protein
MRRYLLLLISLMLGCTNHDNDPMVCNVSNPVQDLSWLKAEIDEGDYSSSQYADYTVYQALYNGEPVFYTEICCPSCNVAPPEVRNCSGELVGYLDAEVNENLKINSADLHNKKVIFETHNGVCD